MDHANDNDVHLVQIFNELVAAIIQYEGDISTVAYEAIREPLNRLGSKIHNIQDDLATLLKMARTR